MRELSFLTNREDAKNAKEGRKKKEERKEKDFKVD
jgi:hypothetical protein